MRRQHLNPKELFEPRGYSHTVAVDGPMTLVTISGQVAFGPDGNVVGKGDMRAQAEQVYQNLSHNLRAAGAEWRDVIKVNVYMVGLTPEASRRTARCAPGFSTRSTRRRARWWA